MLGKVLKRTTEVNRFIALTRSEHVKRLKPAFTSLDRDPHKAIVTISTNIRSTHTIVEESLSAISGVLNLVSRKPDILENPETFHGFALLMQSTSYHIKSVVKASKNSGINLPDATEIRLSRFLKDNFGYNIYVKKALRDHTSLSIPSLIDDQDVERQFNDFRDNFEKYGESGLGKYERKFLLQRSLEIADFTRLQATLTYPFKEYEQQKARISTMIYSLYSQPIDGIFHVKRCFNTAEIGCTYPKTVRTAQDRLLSKGGLEKQIIDLEGDVSTFFNSLGDFHNQIQQ